MVCTCPRLQRTLAIIKPETVKFKDVILRAIKNYELDVLAVSLFNFTTSGEAQEGEQYSEPAIVKLLF